MSNPDNVLPVIYSAVEDVQTEAEIKAEFDELDDIFSEVVDYEEDINE